MQEDALRAFAARDGGRIVRLWAHRGDGQEGRGPQRRPHGTGVVVQKLGVTDTDALWKQKQEAVRSACEGKFGPVWNEITRVLEGLRDDVSKREPRARMVVTSGRLAVLSPRSERHHTASGRARPFWCRRRE